MLLAVAIGIVLGIAADHPATILVIGIIALPFVLLVAFLVRKQALALVTCTSLAAICFGTVLMSASRMQQAHSHLVKASQTLPEDAEIALAGTVDNVRDDGSYFRIVCDTIVGNGYRWVVDGEAAGVFLRVDDSTTPITLTRGMKVTVFSELVPFAEQRNPYAFNYDEY